jgi:hypothetical protein
VYGTDGVGSGDILSMTVTAYAKVLDRWPDQSNEPPKYLSADHHRAVLDII